jgi:hypothetical protein
MSTATNVTYLQYGSSWAAKPFNKGWGRIRLTAIFPSGVNSCTITNIPNLAPDSEIRVAQQAQSGATSKFTEIALGRVNGPVGTVVIATEDTSNTSIATPFMLQIVNQ